MGDADSLPRDTASSLFRARRDAPASGGVSLRAIVREDNVVLAEGKGGR
jgi:hypothetical protein